MHKPETDLSSIIYEIAVHDSKHAYRQLFDLLYPRLRYFAASLLRSNEQAEEVACDTMFVLWSKRVQLLNVDNVRVYAYVIAKNKALNLLKKNAGSCVSFVDEIDVDIAFHELTPEHILITEELKKKH